MDRKRQEKKKSLTPVLKRQPHIITLFHHWWRFLDVFYTVCIMISHGTWFIDCNTVSLFRSPTINACVCISFLLLIVPLSLCFGVLFINLSVSLLHGVADSLLLFMSYCASLSLSLSLLLAVFLSLAQTDSLSLVVTVSVSLSHCHSKSHSRRYSHCPSVALSLSLNVSLSCVLTASLTLYVLFLLSLSCCLFCRLIV